MATKERFPITVTLWQIRAHGPCQDGWKKLLAFLGKTKADDEPLGFSTIVVSNGVKDALWCLRALGGEHRPIVGGLACDFAEHVLPIFERYRPDDPRPRAAIATIRRYLVGEATEKEVVDARAAAAAAAVAAVAAATDATDAADAAVAADAAADAAAAAAVAAATDAADAADAAVAAVAAVAADAADAADAAAAAARTAERQWQAERLIAVFG